jgi:hypothetical protein
MVDRNRHAQGTDLHGRHIHRTAIHASTQPDQPLPAKSATTPTSSVSRSEGSAKSTRPSTGDLQNPRAAARRRIETAPVACAEKMLTLV